MALKNCKDTWDGLTEIQEDKLDELWYRLVGFKHRPVQKGTEKLREWERVGADISDLKKNEKWSIDYTTTSISVEASFVSQLLAGICGSRQGYKTPIKSVNSCKDGVNVEKEHFVRLIDTARYIIHDFLCNKIKTKEILFRDYVYPYQGTILTTKDENTRLKNILDKIWKNKFKKKLKHISEFVNFQKKLLHYAIEEVPLIYPSKEEQDMCIRSRKHYHFDLITTEVEEYCLNDNEELGKIKKEYEKSMFTETNVEVNKNSEKFWK